MLIEDNTMTTIAQPKTATAVTKIFVHSTDSCDIEFFDKLDVRNDKSRIVIIVTSFDADNKKLAQAHFQLSPNELKVHLYDIIQCRFREHVQFQGTARKEDDGYNVRALYLSRNNREKLPNMIRVDNGYGDKYPNGDYELTHCYNSVTLALRDTEMRLMAHTVYDYIRDWEVDNFRNRRAALTYIPGDDK